MSSMAVCKQTKYSSFDQLSQNSCHKSYNKLDLDTTFILLCCSPVLILRSKRRFLLTPKAWQLCTAELAYYVDVSWFRPWISHLAAICGSVETDPNIDKRVAKFNGKPW